jgi:hypothetical protein
MPLSGILTFIILFKLRSHQTQLQSVTRLLLSLSQLCCLWPVPLCFPSYPNFTLTYYSKVIQSLIIRIMGAYTTRKEQHHLFHQAFLLQLHIPFSGSVKLAGFFFEKLMAAWRIQGHESAVLVPMWSLGKAAGPNSLRSHPWSTKSCRLERLSLHPQFQALLPTRRYAPQNNF